MFPIGYRTNVLLAYGIGLIKIYLKVIYILEKVSNILKCLKFLTKYVRALAHKTLYGVSMAQVISFVTIVFSD